MFSLREHVFERLRIRIALPRVDIGLLARGELAAEGLVERFYVTMEIGGARINGLYRWRAGILRDRVFLAAVYQQRIQGPGFFLI